jgi:hypothetical protein
LGRLAKVAKQATPPAVFAGGVGSSPWDHERLGKGVSKTHIVPLSTRVCSVEELLEQAPELGQVEVLSLR